ncbi:MAG: phosphate acyltransferase PlsX [Bacillota bacterium]
MKIIVDGYGGDNAPSSVVEGTINALNSDSTLNVMLVGDKGALEAMLKTKQYDSARLEILDAKEVISNEESPTEAIRKKQDSTIVKGLRQLNTDAEAQAFVSAGSSGAVLTGAVLLLKRIKGINRPALSPVLPTVSGGQTILVDCGANPDCKPMNMHQFARMGAAYAKAELNVDNAKIGLLSNGTEDKKGNELTKAAFQLLKEDELLNFKGNMEARELLSGTYDVIVADGFNGNICLKACEGTAMSMFEIITNNIYGGGLRAKLGYLLLKPVFKNVKGIMDYNKKGGAVLLGLNKIVVKAHGSSKAESITASILQAKRLVEKGLVAKITEAMSTDA